MYREREMIHVIVHPVSITRFPLRRFSPGAGLLRNRFSSLVAAKIFQGLGPKRRESCNGDRVYPTCHILPPSEIPWRPFLAVLQAQKGNNYFTE